MSNFWNELKKPIMALAPMADVTDPAFRRIIAKYSKHSGRDFGVEGKANLPALGGPDVMFTEFVSTDGLCSAGQERLLRDLAYSEDERPIVAQIFGSNPANFTKTAELCVKLGFDGIDINMGCPERNIQKQGSCAALIKDPDLAQEIIRATKKGAGKIPVTVKTRIGYNKNEVETWIPALLEAEPTAITLHGRTKSEMSKVPAHWDVIARAVEIRNEQGSKTLILGNGDVQSVEEAFKRVEQTGVDGIMIGRGIFGNPWLFANLTRADAISSHQKTTAHKNPNKRGQTPFIPTLEEKLGVMIEHTYLFEKLLGDIKNFAIMKKHYKAYVEGFPGAKDLRVKLMEAENGEVVEREVKKFLGIK